MMSQMDWGWGGMIFGPIMMIVIVVLIVLLVRWLVESGRGSASPGSSLQTPLDILKERYAKGEIDKDEFEERRHVLDK
jgi:putative membrane protein